jgi:hypothetical protein
VFAMVLPKLNLVKVDAERVALVERITTNKMRSIIVSESSAYEYHTKL